MGCTRSNSRWTRLIFLLVHLCPCFCEVVTEKSTTDHDYNASESLETPYSALHNTKQEADRFTLWQFKKLAEDDEDNYGQRRVSHEFGGERQYPAPHPLPRIILGGQGPTTRSYPAYSVATPRSAGKHSKFRLPDFRTFFNKHKPKQRGRGPQRPGPPRPPHQAYAPSFISYGPIFGPPPVKDQNQWQSQTQPPNLWQSQPPSQWQSQPQSNQWQSEQQQHRPSHSNKPSSAPPLPPTSATYGTPSNRPYYGGGGFQSIPTQLTPAYGTQQPTMRTYSHPPPTYGPTVRIHYTPPQTQQYLGPPAATTRIPPEHQQQQWPPATTRIPPSQNQGPWNPLPPHQPVHSQWSSVSTNRTPAQSNYMTPTYAPPTPTGGYATPSSSYIPPNQNQPHGRNPGHYIPPAPAADYGVPVRSYEPPMHFGQPMHNFGPPHSSYGQPPPIIGDPPQDRYAPKDDIYRYPTGKESTGNSYNSPRHRYDTYGEETSIEHTNYTPSTDLFQTPRNPYRDPSQRNQKKNKPNPSYEDNYDYNDYSQSNVKSYAPTNPENTNQGQYATDARPPPHYDTNYNSPGLSKDLKIVDWMPYSAKEYHQIPSKNAKKKQKAPKYRTLPKRLRDYRPDPDHVNYPKLTYDTLSRRMSEDENQTQLHTSNQNKSEAETKTEIEDAFHEMLHTHAKPAEIR